VVIEVRVLKDIRECPQRISPSPFLRIRRGEPEIIEKRLGELLGYLVKDVVLNELR
jgi:hypothetical protein